MLGLEGVIAVETSVAGITVRLVDPETVPEAAVIIVEPKAIEVARPLDPAALLIVATEGGDELHTTEPVRSCVVLLE
jgi:hypothetical protein